MEGGGQWGVGKRLGSLWYYTPSRSLVTTTGCGEREGQWELDAGAIGQLYRNNWTLKGCQLRCGGEEKGHGEALYQWKHFRFQIGCLSHGRVGPHLLLCAMEGWMPKLNRSPGFNT